MLDITNKTLTYYNNYTKGVMFDFIIGEQFYFVIGVSAAGLKGKLTIPNYSRYFPDV
jgi:hypothetical protein